MKKIAFYIPSMGGGGAEKVVLLLANYYVSLNYKVDLLLTSASGPYLTRLNEKVNVIDLNSDRALHDIFKLIRYARKCLPDIIISSLSYCNVILLLAAKMFPPSVKVVVCEHTNISARLEESDGIRYRVIKHLMLILYKKADGVVAVSMGVKEGLVKQLKLSVDAVKVIYNPFDIREIQMLSRLGVKHEWLNTERNFKTIISIGRLTAAKDFDTLIDAFSLLSTRKNVRLLILGEGELRDTLQKKINNLKLNDIISLNGFVENPYAYLAKCDLLVSSSKREGLPNVLIESLICGVKVVSTDCPSGPREILEDGKWGELVPVGMSRVLAEAMFDSLLENKEIDFSTRIMDFEQEKISQLYLQYINNC